jgi:hypothetical protein
MPSDIPPLVQDFSSLRPVESVDAVHHHGFSGTVGANDGVNFTLFHFEIHAGQGGNAAEIHVDIIELEEGLALAKLTGLKHGLKPPSIDILSHAINWGKVRKGELSPTQNI